MSDRATIEAAAGLLGDRVVRNEPLGRYSTYRVGGPAALYLHLDDVADLEFLSAATVETGIDVLVVGNGSNLLVADAGFAGLAIRLGDGFTRIDVEDTVIRAGAAALLPVVARRSVAAGLSGFEWAVGVPGSMGGAVRMNAGGHGAEMASSLVGVRVLDLRTGKDGVVPAADLDLGYRRSSVAVHHLVTEVELRLEAAGTPAGDEPRGEALLSEIVRWRRANQPGGHNAGSVFTNPPGDSAGRLIDAAGCRGRRHGSAEVSTKHANFIQADTDGSADDVHVLMGEIVATVLAHSGVRLHPETVLVGFGSDTGHGRGGSP